MLRVDKYYYFQLERQVISMCYTCGCGLPDDDHGKGHAGFDPDGKAITTKTFQAAARALNLGEKEVKKNTHDLLMRRDMEEK